MIASLAPEMSWSQRVDVLNVVALFKRIAEAARRSKPSKEESNPFWSDSVEDLLTYAIYALWSAHGHVSISDIMEMALSAPRSRDQLNDLDWLASSFCFRTVLQMEQKPAHALNARDLEATTKYWKTAFANEDPRTTGNIVAMLPSMINMQPNKTGNPVYRSADRSGAICKKTLLCNFGAEANERGCKIFEN